VYPDDLPMAMDTFSRRLRGEQIPPFELRLRKADGTPLHVEITSARLTEGGEVAGTLGIVRDITARKALAKELELREERFRLVTLATQDAVYDWDLVHDTIWWNERAATMFGVAPPTGAGIEWWKAQIHPDDRARVIAGLDRAAAERQALWTDEYRFRHTGGGWRVLMDMGMYLYAEDGTPVRMIGAMSDITERRQGELEQVRLQAALQAAATDWTATFDAVPMHALLVNAEGKIQRLNRSARDAAGLTWTEALQRPLATLPGGLWRYAAELVGQAFASSAPVVGQHEEEGAARVWNLVAAPVVTSMGVHAVLLIRDTTDLVQLQRTLAHQQTMAALGAVVAGVAHEVRNPLFAISATLDAFEARFGKEPEFSKYPTNLRPEVQRLSALMRDLLEYGRPPALQIVAADLVPVIRETIARSEGPASARGVELRYAAEAESCLVPHDPARMAQVIQNLLDNALVHAPAGSTIHVTLAPVTEGTSRRLALAIEDEGPGFRPQDLPHVFEPFYSKRRGGTGLGLSIVERLVDQHGGRVRAENRPGGGARVTVLLPLP
ncbi:MAG TPA: ATP-binding protein, partial [Gemmatimonadales bacterium]|nr:ATP-binding protein [Gemmatimonadales bacterium]